MKKTYILKEDAKVTNELGKYIIPKGTIILSNGYIDEDDGIMGIYKGRKVVFSISELEEVK